MIINQFSTALFLAEPMLGRESKNVKDFRQRLKGLMLAMLAYANGPSEQLSGTGLPGDFPALDLLIQPLEDLLLPAAHSLGVHVLEEDMHVLVNAHLSNPCPHQASTKHTQRPANVAIIFQSRCVLIQELFRKDGFNFVACNNVRDILHDANVITDVAKLIVIMWVS